MKQRIVYIAGLGHSGSTILDLAMGSHPDAVGLGEVYTLLRRKQRQNHMGSLCSCGKKATACPFWSKLDKTLEDSDDLDGLYAQLITQFQDHFGPDKVLIDSSKNSYAYLKTLNGIHSLKVIFLTRDIRSWIYSRHLATRKPLLALALRWYAENRKLHFQLKRMGIACMKVGYEELSFYPERVLPLICEFTGIQFKETMLRPTGSQSHIISGNIARTDPMKKKGFIYDARWLVSRRIFLLSPLLACFMKMNRRNVFSNALGNGIKDFYLFGNERRKKFTDTYN